MADTCSTCGEPITWAATRKTRMPLNPDPVPTGNVRVTDSRAVPGQPFATVLGGEKLATARAEGVDLYESHSATCRDARQHRRKR